MPCNRQTPRASLIRFFFRPPKGRGMVGTEGSLKSPILYEFLVQKLHWEWGLWCYQQPPPTREPEPESMFRYHVINLPESLQRLHNFQSRTAAHGLPNCRIFEAIDKSNIIPRGRRRAAAASGLATSANAKPAASSSSSSSSNKKSTVLSADDSDEEEAEF